MSLLPGTTPAAPDDVGDCDAALAAAVASGDGDAISVAMLQSRLLVPVVAMPVTEGDAEMAVPTLVADDGRRALPVFSAWHAMRAWRADARPVPMSGARVFAGASTEGYDGVVLDVAGPVPHTVSGDALRTMARAATALVANPTARVSAVE